MPDALGGRARWRPRIQHHPPGKSLTFREIGAGTPEFEVAVVVCLLHASEKLAAKNRRHGGHGEKVAAAGGYPLRLVQRQPSRRHDTMGVGMETQIASPGMQDGRDPNLRLESAMAELEQRPRRCLQQ